MTCPNCGDTGTVSRPVGVGDLMGTEPCECVKEPETCPCAGEYADCTTCYYAGRHSPACEKCQEPAPESETHGQPETCRPADKLVTAAEAVILWFQEGLVGGSMDKCSLCEADEPPHVDGCPVPIAQEALDAHWAEDASPPQPTPEHGAASEPVEDIASVKWGKARLEQHQKGMTTYGVPLMTFNGLHQADMCRKKLVDANNYLTALEMERNHLAELLRRALLHLYDADVAIPEARQLAVEVKTALEGMKHD